MPYFYRNNIKYSGGSDSVDLTMAEYKELEANGKVVQDTTYYIIDADENIPSRPNLLINSNFANPVNQRGITAEIWVVDTYGIDRWVLWNAGAKVSSINSNGITFFNEIGSNNPYGAVLEQRIELSEIEYEKPYTLSACIDGEIYSISTIVKNEQLYSLEILNNVKIEIDARDNRYLNVKIRNYNTTPITVKWAKLELGDHATPYVPRMYMEELWLCQRYFQILQNDFLLVAISQNAIAFKISTFTHHIRAKGKATLVSPAISSNGTVQIGFTFAVTSVGFSSVAITASKSSHGITANNIPIMGGYVELDAEL